MQLRNFLQSEYNFFWNVCFHICLCRAHDDMMYGYITVISIYLSIYMFYASYKSSINYQKNSIVKDKIKTNVHFDNTFTVTE